MATVLYIKIGNGQVTSSIEESGTTRIVAQRPWRSALSPFDEVEINWLFEFADHTPWGPHRDRARRANERVLEIGRQLWSDAVGPDPGSHEMVSHADAVIIQSSERAVLTLPWEAICHPGSDAPVGASGTIVARRFGGETEIGRARPIRRALLVVARPSDMYSPSLAGVAGTVARRLHGSQVTVDLLMSARAEETRESITHAQAQGRPYDLVHLDVHGVAESLASGVPSALVFEESGGKMAQVPLPQVLDWAQSSGVDTVVLSACRSVRPAAYSMLKYGGHVVGLSHELHPEAVRCFADGFYASLASGASVAQATTNGREALRTSGSDHAQAWPAIKLVVNGRMSLSDNDSRADHVPHADAALARLDDATVGLLNQSLRAAQSVDLYAPRGYGRTALLNEVRRWTDTFLATTPGIWLDGTRPLDELTAEVRRHAISCPPATEIRPLRTALYIDDADRPNLLDVLAGVAGENVAVVASTVARTSESATCIAVPRIQLRGKHLLERGFSPEVVADLALAVDGLPQLIEAVGLVGNPCAILASPWSASEGALTQEPPVSHLLPAVPSVLTSAMLVTGLLAPRYPFAAAIGVLGALEADIDRPAATEDNGTGRFLKMLASDEDAVVRAATAGVDSVAQIAVLRTSGFITSSTDLTMWVNPLAFLAAVTSLDPAERVAGSRRLDGLAEMYADSLMLDVVRVWPHPTRFDLAASCLLYCARRGLHKAALLILMCLSPAVGRRKFESSYLGDALRQSLAAQYGGRPPRHAVEAHNLWVNSFRFSESPENRAAMHRESDLISQELAAGVELDRWELEVTLVGKAALAADEGRIEESFAGYTEIVRTATTQMVKAQALRGLALLAMDKGDTATAREMIDQLSALPRTEAVGAWRAGPIHDLGLLDAAVSIDGNDGWAGLARWDTEAASPTMASDQLDKRARELHERGLASIQLGLLTEAQRLLDEAVRLKFQLGDPQLLATSLHAQAGLSLQRGATSDAVGWLSEINALAGVKPNQRLTAAILALDPGLKGVAFDVIRESQDLAASEVAQALADGGRVDAELCFEWCVRLHNAKHLEIGRFSMEAMRTGRLGDRAYQAAATGFLAARDERMSDIDSELIACLEGAHDLPGRVHMRVALAECLALRALSVRMGEEKGDHVPDEARVQASTDSLRSLRIHLAATPEMENPGVAVALALAIDLSHKRGEAEWLELADTVAVLPLIPSRWTDLATRAVFMLVDGASDPTHPAALVLHRVTSCAAGGSPPVGLCGAISNGVEHLLSSDLGSPRIRPEDCVTPLLSVIENAEASPDAWFRVTGCLTSVAFALATSGETAQLRQLADRCFEALALRGWWDRGERIAACLMYDGISALSSDLARAKSRCDALGQMFLEGGISCGIAWQSLVVRTAPLILRNGEPEWAVEALVALTRHDSLQWPDEVASEQIEALESVIADMPDDTRMPTFENLLCVIDHMDKVTELATNRIKLRRLRVDLILYTFGATADSGLIDRGLAGADDDRFVSDTAALEGALRLLRAIAQKPSGGDRWRGTELREASFMERVALDLLRRDLLKRTRYSSGAIRLLVSDIKIAQMVSFAPG